MLGDNMRLNNKTIVIPLVVITIIFIIIGIKNNNDFNSKMLPIDPLTDLRNYVRNGLEISDEEVPNEILTNSSNVIASFEENLRNNGIDNIKIVKIENYIEKRENSYALSYLILNKDLNEQKGQIFLWSKNAENIFRIRMDLNNRNQEETLIYNKSMIDVGILSITSDNKEKIVNGLKENYEQKSWNLGAAYTYENLDSNNLKVIFYYLNKLGI